MSMNLNIRGMLMDYWNKAHESHPHMHIYPHDSEWHLAAATKQHRFKGSATVQPGDITLVRLGQNEQMQPCFVALVWADVPGLDVPSKCQCEGTVGWMLLGEGFTRA